MPRIREPEPELGEDPAQVAAEVEVPTASNGAQSAPKATEAKPKRSRRPAPEGVSLGALEAPVPVELPPTAARSAGGRGRTVDNRTLKIIETVNATPGQWFHIGTYMSPQSPTKDQLLGQQGFEFRNVRNESGAFDRYAMLPVSDGAA